MKYLSGLKSYYKNRDESALHCIDDKTCNPPFMDDCIECCCSPDDTDCKKLNCCCDHNSGGVFDLICKKINSEIIAIEIKDTRKIGRYISDIESKYNKTKNFWVFKEAIVMVPKDAQVSGEDIEALTRIGKIKIENCLYSKCKKLC